MMYLPGVILCYGVSCVMVLTRVNGVSPCYGVNVMDGDVGHTAEGGERQTQGGPKGRQLEVGARRSPRLLVSLIYPCPTLTRMS